MNSIFAALRRSAVLVPCLALISAAGYGFAECRAEADTRFLRAGGYAELAGEVRLRCTEISPSAPIDLTVEANADITSRLLDETTGRLEALLIIGDPATPTIGVDAFYAVAGSNARTIIFPGIPLPASQDRLVRILNVRVDTNRFDPSVTGRPAAVEFSVRALSVLIDGSPLVTGNVVGGYTSMLSRANGQSAVGLDFTEPNNGTSFNWFVTFREAFPAAFRRRNDATTPKYPETIADQQAASDQSESGYYHSSLGAAGLASSGTELLIKFTNIPDGVELFVTTRPLSGSIKARFLGSMALGIVNTTDGPVEVNKLLVDFGTATAQYEVTGSDEIALESAVFGVVAKYSAVRSGTAPVAAELGPTGNNMIDGLPYVPRFISGQYGVCSGSCFSVPSVLSVTYTIGDPNPTPLMIPVNGTGGNFAVAVDSTGWLKISPGNPNWLTISPASGAAPATLTASINPVQLAPGEYPGVITITPEGPGSAPQFVYIALKVRASSNPAVVSPFSCAASAGAPRLMRRDGLAELGNDFTLQCAGATEGAPINTTIRLKTEFPITSRSAGIGSLTEALLMVDDPTQVIVGTNAVQGVLLDENTIEFPNVRTTGTGPGQSRVLRIVNLRVNCFKASDSSPISNATATASASGISIVGPSQVFGYAVDSAVTELRTISDETISSIPFSLVAQGSDILYKVHFQEGFASAFKPRNIKMTPETPDLLGDQKGAGFFYGTETGFYDSTFTTDNRLNIAGLATQGTRLMARFTNVPAGVALYVSTANLIQPGPYNSFVARLVTTDAAGAGPFQATAASRTATVQAASSSRTATFQAAAPSLRTATAQGTTVDMAQVQIVGGQGIAVWEVLQSQTAVSESFEFGVLPVYSGVPGGAASVMQALAPMSTVTGSDPDAPLPRFPMKDPGGCGSCLNVPASVDLSTVATPVSTTLTVNSSGVATGFTISTAGTSWLSVNMAGGVTPATLTVTADPAGLSAGTHHGTVLLTAGSDTRSVTVNFTVSGTLELSASRLEFAGVQNGPMPAAQTVSVTAPGGQSWTATSNTAWASVTPAVGVGSGQLTIRVNPQVLLPGSHLAMITVRVGQFTRVLMVTLTVNEQPAELLPSLTEVTLTPGGKQTLTVAGQGRLIVFSAFSTAAWLKVTPDWGTTPINLTLSADGTGLAAGSHTASVRLSSSEPGVATKTIRVTLQVNPVLNSHGSAASYAGGTITPGQLLLLGGSGFGPDALVSGEVRDGRLPTTLAGVRALFDGIGAPIVYVQRNAVAVIVPNAVAGRSSVNVELEADGRKSAVRPIGVSGSAPGIFTANASGTGMAAALNQDGTLHDEAHPAAGGEIVVLYGTGGGALNPAGADGMLNTAPYGTPVNGPVTATIGGTAAEVLYGGAAPGLVNGSLQINVRVPSGLAPGAQPVLVRIGNGESQPGVTVFVK